VLPAGGQGADTRYGHAHLWTKTGPRLPSAPSRPLPTTPPRRTLAARIAGATEHAPRSLVAPSNDQHVVGDRRSGRLPRSGDCPVRVVDGVHPGSCGVGWVGGVGVEGACSDDFLYARGASGDVSPVEVGVGDQTPGSVLGPDVAGRVGKLRVGWEGAVKEVV
jgi:hypothetical protein